jgi:DNA-binding response OmpR family regulator
MPIACPLCDAMQAAPEGDLLWVRCPDCSGMVFKSSPGPAVLVAHGSEEISQQIGSVLLNAGFAPLRAAHGGQALKLLDRRRPVAAVLDVGLGEVMSFQLIEYVRRHRELNALPVVLIASVFNSAAYKRRPHSLYGADDYVEQHHIPDLLPGKLGQLLHVKAGKDHADVDERRARIHEGEARADLAGVERVKVLARSIVADIALYNEAELATFLVTRELTPLTKALDEGRRLLLEMTNIGDHAGRDPILEAFHAMIARMEAGSR